MFSSITSQTEVHRASPSQTLGKKQSLLQPSSWRGKLCERARRPFQKQSLWAAYSWLSLWGREEGAWVILPCAYPLLWLVEELLKATCSWGCPGLFRERTHLSDAPESTEVAHLLVDLPAQCQEGGRWVCCQPYLQMQITFFQIQITLQIPQC